MTRYDIRSVLRSDVSCNKSNNAGNNTRELPRSYRSNADFYAFMGNLKLRKCTQRACNMHVKIQRRGL